MGKKLMALGLTGTIVGTAAGAAWFALIPNSPSTGDVLGTMGSYNWAGYVNQAVSTPYTSITGSWTVPSISGVNQSADAEWIGLGGVQSQALLQMGTVQTMSNGQQQDILFWEKLPQAATPIATVSPGDVVHVTIAKSTGNNWDLTATIQHGSQTTTKHVAVTLSSAYTQNIEQTAEWIREDPENTQQQIVPMANAGTVTFSQATVNGQPIQQSNAITNQSVLVPPGAGTEIAPGSLSQNGTSFTTSPTTAPNIQGYPPSGAPSSGMGPGSGSMGGWPGPRRWERHGFSSQGGGWPAGSTQWQVVVPETANPSSQAALWQALQALQSQINQETSQWQQLLSQTSSTQGVPWSSQTEGSQGQQVLSSPSQSSVQTYQGSGNGWQWTIQVQGN